MISESLVKLENPVLRFTTSGEMLYIISGKEIIKVNSITGQIIHRETVFPKDNKTRDFVIDHDEIYCRDFYQLYKVDRKTLQIDKTWQFGSDLSSDICTLGLDEACVYVCIRNGDFAVIDKMTGKVKIYPLSGSSIWEIIVSDCIYAGNVDGDLLVIDKSELKVLEQKAIHKKNLKSLLLVDDVIYTASQDLSISKVNQQTLEIIDNHKHCHKRMFYFAGNWEDYLLTVSPPCREMKFWRKSDLSLYKTIYKGEWDSIIDGNKLYEKDGNSIICTNLNDLINNS